MDISKAIEIKNLSIGFPKKLKYGDQKEIKTGICKDTVDEAFLTKNGFIGDGVADLRYHGGLDRAVCVYPYEHYLLWEEEFATALPSATFGENLTVLNMLEKDVHIGDVFQLGDAVIQITQGRIPCSTITKRTNNPQLLKRLVETGYTGYLCRVLQEGNVRKNSSLTLLEPDSHKVSVLYANEIYLRKPKDLKGIEKVLSVEALANDWKEFLTKRYNNLTSIEKTE